MFVRFVDRESSLTAVGQEHHSQRTDYHNYGAPFEEREDKRLNFPREICFNALEGTQWASRLHFAGHKVTTFSTAKSVNDRHDREVGKWSS